MREEGKMDSEEGQSPSTIGPLLQGARTAKGLTIEAAAAASKVPLSFVRLMEEEQFHLVPDSVYLIRFLTEYATFLGLDPKQVGALLQDQVRSARRESGLSRPVPSIGSQIELRRLAIYLLPAVVVIPLIFIVLSLLSGQEPVVPPDRQPESTESRSQDSPTPLPETVTTLPPSSQAPSLSTVPSQGLTQAPLPVTTPAPQDPQKPPARYRLRAEAKETTWIGVSADGAPRKQTVLHSGETVSWWADNGFIVSIGNVGGVTLSLNGQPLPLKGAPGQVIKNLAIPGEGWPPSGGQ